MKLTKENPFKDLLSVLFYEYSEHNTTQAMTPFELADSISKMRGIKNTGPYLFDISCGTGALLLAAIKNYSSTEKLNILANDIDNLMCKITTIQILTNHLVHTYNKF